MSLETLVLNIVVLTLAVNSAIAIYGIALRPNLIKKILSLNILSDTACILVAYVGFRKVEHPRPPVYFSGEGDAVTLLTSSVDPLTHAFIVTAIVIGLAFTILLSVITVRLYEVYGSVNLHRALKEAAEEVFEVESEVKE